MDERTAGERGRWLSAVLIVVAIAATSLVVRLWPGPPARQPLLASRPLLLVDDGPRLEPSAAVFATRFAGYSDIGRAAHVGALMTAPPRSGLPQAENVGPTTRLEPIDAQTDVASASGPLATVPAVLAGRTIAVHADAAPSAASVIIPRPPAVAPTAGPPSAEPALRADAADSPAAGPALPAVPAIAVARALAVAGRGIKSGLLATGNAFRAAF